MGDGGGHTGCEPNLAFFDRRLLFVSLPSPHLLACVCLFARAPSYAGFSKKGYAPYNPRKHNQDALIMAEDASTGSLFLAVMDGHGEVGEKVAQVSEVLAVVLRSCIAASRVEVGERVAQGSEVLVFVLRSCRYALSSSRLVAMSKEWRRYGAGAAAFFLQQRLGTSWEAIQHLGEEVPGKARGDV